MWEKSSAARHLTLRTIKLLADTLRVKVVDLFAS
jgi:hypothetical protein